AHLHHPHIRTLIDSGEADGFVYYVMPFVEGESLRQRLEREGQLPLDEALRLTRAIASALDFAHGRGVIHRDIKPENIMLHQGEPMVADFGIALAVSAAGRERLTETGLSPGTPAYMSPEQASAEARFRASRDSKGGHNLSNVAPFTSSRGAKFGPAFSPDGNEIAYAWRGENEDNFDIYIKLIGAGGPLRLTSNPAAEYCPAWSPDGRNIAFYRKGPSSDRGAYYIIPALGGTERKIGEQYGEYYGFGRCIDWSRDGKSLIVADRMAPEDSRSSIMLLSIEDGRRTALVSQPDLYVANPSLSPDGTAVAYIQGAGFLAGDIYVVPVSGGRPRRVTSDGRTLNGLAWTADGREIVFASNRGGLWRLWRVT